MFPWYLSSGVTVITFLIHVLKMHQCKLEHSEGYIDRSRFWGTRLCQFFQDLILISPKSPLCAKFFRSEMAIKAEKERHLNSGHAWVIHPLSEFRTWYQVLSLLIHMASLFGKPIDAAFANKFAPLYSGHVQITILIDFLCVMDIIMNFVTGYIVKKTRKIELDPKQIAKNYLMSPFFVCDFLSSTPRNIAYAFTKNPDRFWIGVLNVFILFRIVRIITVVSLIYGISQNFVFKKSKTLVFLFCSLCVTAVIVHWLACLQQIIPRLIERYFSAVKTSNSWIHKNGLYYKPVGHKYLNSFFKTSAEILGMRMPWYKLETTDDYIISIVTFIVGKILMVSTWIILAVTLLNARTMEIKFEEIINQLDEYMRQKQLPFDLRNRLSQYYKFKYQKKYFKEDMINELLSAPLRKEVNINVCKSLISNVSLFADLTPDQLSLLVSQLIPEIFLPKDTIVQSGTTNESMFFLSSGTVAVYTHSGKEMCHLQDGDHFGEICLIFKNRLAQMTIVAIEFTQVYRLKNKDFERILMKNKVVYNKIVQEAEYRLKAVRQFEETYKREIFEKTFQKNDGKMA